MHYIGEFGDDGFFHGNGVMKYQDGSTYYGEWCNGKRHGMGTYMNQKKSTHYTGGWKDDVMEGKGILLRIVPFTRDHKTNITETYDGTWKSCFFRGSVLYEPETQYNEEEWEFNGWYVQQQPWLPDRIEKQVYGRGKVYGTDRFGYTEYHGEVKNQAVYHGIGSETWDDSPMYYKKSEGLWKYGELVIPFPIHTTHKGKNKKQEE